MAAPLLDVRDLAVGFATPHGPVAAVDGLSFTLRAGETLALVGESGCGKSVTGLALMGLLDPRAAAVDGSARLEGEEILNLPPRLARRVRGRRIAMVFQDPMAALNPVMTVGDQVVEAVRAHEPMGGTAARRRAAELLDLVRLPDPARQLDDYPHRFSGGMRQRIGIAIALAGRPALLIADEPTTALDVTVQAQILHLLAGLQRELGMAMLLITHDLGVVAETADRVLVMYAGRRAEEREVCALFEDPWHPYTWGLIGARPQPRVGRLHRPRLTEIPGLVPDLARRPAGCLFAPRCTEADAGCHADVPAFRTEGAGGVACHKVPASRLSGAA